MKILAFLTSRDVLAGKKSKRSEDPDRSVRGKSRNEVKTLTEASGGKVETK